MEKSKVAMPWYMERATDVVEGLLCKGEQLLLKIEDGIINWDQSPKEPSKDEAEFVKTYSEAMKEKNYTVMNEMIQNPETRGRFNMICSYLPNYYDDKYEFMMLSSMANSEEELSEYLTAKIESDKDFFERVVWYFYAKDQNYSTIKKLENCETFTNLINELCRKNNVPEIFGVVSPVSEGHFKIKNEEENANKEVPLNFTYVDANEKAKNPSPEKTVKHANKYVERIEEFANKVLPNCPKSFELQTNGSIIMMVNGYSYTFDPGLICGNDIYLSSLGMSKTSGNPIWIPIPMKNSKLVEKALLNPGYILTIEEAEQVLSELFDNTSLYNYVDLSNNNLENISIQEYKALGHNIERAIVSAYQQIPDVRFRLANYKDSHNFELVSDANVKFPYESCVKNIIGTVLTVSNESVVVSSPTNGIHSVPFME